MKLISYLHNGNFIWNLFHILTTVTSYATEKTYCGEQNAENGTEPFQNTKLSAFRNRTDDRLFGNGDADDADAQQQQ